MFGEYERSKNGASDIFFWWETPVDVFPNFFCQKLFFFFVCKCRLYPLQNSFGFESSHFHFHFHFFPFCVEGREEESLLFNQ